MYLWCLALALGLAGCSLSAFFSGAGIVKIGARMLVFLQTSPPPHFPLLNTNIIGGANLDFTSSVELSTWHAEKKNPVELIREKTLAFYFLFRGWGVSSD